MDPVSTPPPRRRSSSRLPVPIWMISERLTCTSLAVVKPIGTSFAASTLNYTTIQVHFFQFDKNFDPISGQIFILRISPDIKLLYCTSNSLMAF